MKFKVLAVIFSALLSGVLAKAATDKMNMQTDYLRQLLNAAKLRPTVNGDLNFSPHEGEFANIVRSIAGKMS